MTAGFRSPNPAKAAITAGDLAGCIDHTLLAATANAQDIRALCQQATFHRFTAVCVQPCWVSLARQALKDTPVSVCTVVGFPMGANATAIKAAEATQAIADGADEIDMVVNLGWVKSARWSAVEADIRAVRAATEGKVLKLILETADLTSLETDTLCLLARACRVDFVKTSTGYSKNGGATVDVVRRMSELVSPDLGVKASGGIKTREDALAMIAAGATRLGTSAGIAIVYAPSPNAGPGPGY